MVVRSYVRCDLTCWLILHNIFLTISRHASTRPLRVKVEVIWLRQHSTVDLTRRARGMTSLFSWGCRARVHVRDERSMRTSPSSRYSSRNASHQSHVWKKIVRNPVTLRVAATEAGLSTAYVVYTSTGTWVTRVGTEEDWRYSRSFCRLLVLAG